MARTASPLTAIRKIREELTRLESTLGSSAGGAPKKMTKRTRVVQRKAKKVGRQSATVRSCSICRKPGHYSRTCPQR